jgi:hypothetical protein
MVRRVTGVTGCQIIDVMRVHAYAHTRRAMRTRYTLENGKGVIPVTSG